MTVQVAQVLRDAGAGQDDSGIATEVLAEATAYVDDYVTENQIDPDVDVPEAVLDAAVLACAGDLFARRKAPFGQQVSPDGSKTIFGASILVGIGSDPMASARAKLRPWCFVIGFAYPEDCP